MDMSNEDSTCFVGICKLVSPLYIKDISITDKTPGTKFHTFVQFDPLCSFQSNRIEADSKASKPCVVHFSGPFHPECTFYGFYKERTKMYIFQRKLKRNT